MRIVAKCLFVNVFFSNLCMCSCTYTLMRDNFVRAHTHADSCVGQTVLFGQQFLFSKRFSNNCLVNLTMNPILKGFKLKFYLWIVFILVVCFTSVPYVFKINIFSQPHVFNITCHVLSLVWAEKKWKKILYQFLFKNQGWVVYTKARYAGINAVLDNVNFF